jgi:putative endonuclease
VYYAGIALDVEHRFFRHVFGLGAKFTRARPPVRVLAAREYPSKGDALRAEFELKALPRAEKLAFFEPKA